MVMFGRILDCKCDLRVSNSAGEGAAIVSRTSHLNEGIKRLPTRSLEILLGLEYDLVSPGLKRV